MTDTSRSRSDAAAGPMTAADTELMSRLEADWQALAASGRFRTQLRRWAMDDPRLAFVTGEELVAAAQRRDMTDWHERDRPLAALLERFDYDPVARRVALQIVLPGLKHLIDGVRAWDTEERASRVVTEAIEVLDRCARAEAGTAPNFRVFMNTRRRVIRAATKARSEPVSLSGDLAGFTNEPDPLVEPHDETWPVRWRRTRVVCGDDGIDARFAGLPALRPILQWFLGAERQH